MSEEEICSVNSPEVSTVAKIVSPLVISSCWKFIDGAAKAKFVERIIRKNSVHLIYAKEESN